MESTVAVDPGSTKGGPIKTSLRPKEYGGFSSAVFSSTRAGAKGDGIKFPVDDKILKFALKMGLEPEAHVIDAFA